MPKRSPLTPSTITPPSLDRQHSYNVKTDPSQTSTGNATAVLTNLRTRSVSPAREGYSPTVKSKTSPVSTPLESPQTERRTSWEDCMHQRDGYISFPDFDLLSRQRESYANRQ